MESKEATERIRLKLEGLRYRHRMTQKQLAGLAGTDCAMISEYECGKTTPKIVTLVKICDALGVKLSEILEECGL